MPLPAAFAAGETYYLGGTTTGSCPGKCENLATTTGTASTTTTQSFTPGPALDASGGFTGTWASGSSFTISSFATTSAPDVVVAWIVTYASGSSVSVTSVSDSASAVAWQSTARWSATSCSGTQETTETEWWGVAASPISSADTITVALSGAPTAASAQAYGIARANTASPFDPNAAVPATAVSGCTATTARPTVTLSATTNEDDLVIASVGAYTSVTEAAPSGFTLVKNLAGTGDSQSVVYKAVVAVQASLNCPNFAATTYWRVLCDAVSAAPEDLEIEPQIGGATTTGTPSTSAPMGYAWESSSSLGGATIESGTWTFTMTAKASSVTGTPVGYLWATVWSCNDQSLGTCTFLLKNYDNTTNVLASTTATAYSYTTGTVGPFSNVKYLAVQFWLIFVSSGSAAARTATETTVSSASSVTVPNIDYASSAASSISMTPSLPSTGVAAPLSSSLSVGAAISTVRGYAVSIATSLGLATGLQLGLAGVSEGASASLTPGVSGLLSFFAAPSVSLTLAPAVGEGLQAISEAASLSLAPGVDQAIGGIAEAASLSVAPALVWVVAFAHTLSASITIAPSAEPGLSQVTQSVTLVLSPALAATAAFMESLAQSMSLSPSSDQGLGATSSASVGIAPAVAAMVAFMSTLSASLSLAPGVEQGIAAVALSAGSTIGAAANLGIGGVTEAVGTTLAPVLAGMVAFFEAVLGMTHITPSLGVADGLTELASVSLAPSLGAVASVPPAAVTVVACSPAVVALGLSTNCTVKVTGASPTGTVSFSSSSGGFTPSACPLAGGACVVSFLPPSSGAFTINATYSGDSANSASWQTFLLRVPAFSIDPSGGFAGTVVALSGTGFAPSTVYDYCFEPGASTVSAAVACASAHQFVSTSSGAVPQAASIVPLGQSGLVVVSGTTGAIAATRSFSATPANSLAAIGVSPVSGPTGTPVVVTGSGFTPGDVVAFTYTNGTLATQPPAVSVSASGTFAASFRVPTSGPAANTITAIGADPGDWASATFTATNVAGYQSASVTLPASGGLTIDETNSTGVSLSISSSPGSSWTIVVAGLTGRASFGVPTPSLVSPAYYDVYLGGGTPGGATVQVCFTQPSLNAGSVMEYWNGASWVSVDSVVSSSRICNTGAGSGVITAAELTGTNFAVGTPLVEGGGGGVLYVSQSITLTEAAGLAPETFSLSGCGVVPASIAGDGRAHHLSALPSCAVTVSPTGSQEVTRYVFSDGADSLQITTCGGPACSSSSNATYYEQTLQTLSYAVVGSEGGYSAPSLASFALGVAHPITLTAVPTGYWVDAVGSLGAPASLQGGGSLQRWALAPSSQVLSAAVPNQAVFAYALQYLVTFVASPPGGGSVAPAGADWLNATSTVGISATPAAGFRFAGWSSASGGTSIADRTAANTTAVVGGPDTMTATFAQASTTTSTTSSSTRTTTTTTTTTSTTSSASSSTRSTSSTSSSASSSSSSTSTTSLASNTTTTTSSSSSAAAQGLARPPLYLLVSALAAALAVAVGLAALRRKRR